MKKRTGWYAGMLLLAVVQKRPAKILPHLPKTGKSVKVAE
jgi:hypothetical protein